MENGVDSLPSIDMNEVDVNDYYNNNNDTVDDVSLSGTVACGYHDNESQDDDNSEGVFCAHAFSHHIDWSHGSESEEEEEDNEEEIASKKKEEKNEYYEQKDLPASPDDTAHVFLADLCRHIRAPLYAYDEILQWAQVAYLSGYHFPTNAPNYRSLISMLRSCLCLNHLSHGTATIQKSGGGTLDFPVFEFESMFYDLIDDHHISPNLLINFEYPNKPPAFNSQFLDEIHTGKWHRLISKQLLIEPNDVLCGIIFFLIALTLPTSKSSQCTH
jgi:hypothetical protein